jgi:hypothetical protein
MTDLTVQVDGQSLTASWTDENPETRAAIADALPVEGDATRWGKELYFSIPVDVGPENGREEVPVGAVAYWPGGNALCLFWGPTPASRGDEPRAGAPVNVVARLENAERLDGSESGSPVVVDRA